MSVPSCCNPVAQQLSGQACDEPVLPNPCGGIHVCCLEYAGVDEAWKKTGIPPNKLRFMAGSPAFENIYWV